MSKTTRKITGSVQSKGDKYYAVIRVPDANGQSRLKWVSTDIHISAKTKRQREQNRKEAERALARVIQEYEERVLLQSDELFLNCLKEWLERQKNQVRQDTWDSYDSYCRTHIIPYFSQKELQKLRIGEITPRHIQRYIDQKHKAGLSATTIKHHKSVLNGVFKQALRFDMIPFNPCERVNLPKGEKFRAKAYNPEQAKKLLQVIKGDPLEPAVMLGLYLGLRRSECLGLRWSDIDFERNVVHIRNTIVQTSEGIVEAEQTKSRASRRDLPLSLPLKEYLLGWRKRLDDARELMGDCYTENIHVCCWIDGRDMKPDYLSRHIKIIFKNNDMSHIRFHGLRHTAGSLLINSGQDAKRVQEILGHEDISTTLNIYTHLTTETKRQTVETLANLLE